MGGGIRFDSERIKTQPWREGRSSFILLRILPTLYQLATRFSPQHRHRLTSRHSYRPPHPSDSTRRNDMSATEIADGVYHIVMDSKGRLTGTHPGDPLHLLPDGAANQMWQVRRHHDNQHLITLKGKGGMGATYPL